jgi:hypothetical protein
MRSFILAVLIACGLGLAAASVLNTEQKTAAQAFATGGARVGDAGNNLVGDWGNHPGQGSKHL